MWSIPMSPEFPFALQQGEEGSKIPDFLGDPLVLQIGLGLLFLLVLFRIVWVLKRSLRLTRARKRLSDYLEAVESVLSGDPQAGVPKLERILADDPENLGARLALARAHLDLKRPAEAHRRNLEAIEVFGAEGAGVELAMIRSLVAAGEEGEALERLERAAERFPADRAIWELSWELHENCGLFEEAVRAGRKILAERPDEEVRKRLARTSAKAGTYFLQRGEKKKAHAFFKESLGLNPDEIQSRRGILALDPSQGEKAVDLPLLADDEKEGEVPSGSQVQVQDPQPGLFLSNARWRDLLTDAKCPVCHAPRNPDWDDCKSCGDPGPSVYSHEKYTGMVPNPKETLDGIERNETWVRKQIEKAQSGDEEALEELRSVGREALLQLLTFLCSTPHPLQVLFDLCLGLAQEFPGDFLEAVHQLEEGKSGFRGFLGLQAPGREIIGDLVGKLGPSALPVFRKELDSAEALSKPQRRSMILDYFVGLKDSQEFDSLFARFSPFEILRHLNKSAPERVADLMVTLAASEAPSRSLFVEEALGCEEALVLALGRSEGSARKRIMRWILTKGPRPTLLHRLVEELDREETGPFEEVLEGFALGGRKVLVERFADPSLSPRCSAALQRILLKAGTGVIADLCRCFGSAPAPSDDRIRSLLAQFGSSAVPEILRAYRQQRGFLALLGIQQNLARHARSLLLRTFHQIDPSGSSFEAIQSFEKDPELLSLLRFLRSEEGGEHA